jgi:hypothetical protein
MIRIGTSHFVSRAHAIYYHVCQGYSLPDAEVVVGEKIADREISFGEPALKPGQRLEVVDGDTRYAIVED